MRPIAVAIFDFDNTLWENMGATEAALSAMVARLVARSGADRAAVIEGFHAVLLDESINDFPDCLRHHPALKAAHPGLDGAAIEALHADAVADYYAELKRQTRPYPGVEGLLDQLAGQGVRCVAFSETRVTTLADRTLAMGLDGRLQVLYGSAPEFSPPRPGVPVECRPVTTALAHTTAKGLHHCGWPKSSPAALTAILADLGCTPKDAVMIGDHVVRDVANAQALGVAGAWAAYGRESLDRLEVTARAHPYVARVVSGHRQAAQQEIRPDMVLHSPAQLLGLVLGPAARAELAPAAPAQPGLGAPGGGAGRRRGGRRGGAGGGRGGGTGR